MSANGVPPPDFTPPAHVRKMELRLEKAIKSLQEEMRANHLAVLHELGELAAIIRGLL